MPCSDGPPSAVRAEDESAFWQMAERERAYLKGVAARVLGDQLAAKTDPSSVVQRGLVAALENFAQLEGTDDHVRRAWLVRIVRNEALNQLRHHHQEMRDVRREQPLEAGSSGGPQLTADNSSPSEQAAQREQAVCMMARLDQLASDHRQVIELRNLQSLSFAEVAARMDRSEAAVRQLWVRAIDQLREALGEAV
ncbi:MAG: sigma-70 family RNA polymerase sigma factor [Gemmataceae bacterium]|nr:sigma-70 family RNA polymerase sigma factor [Gemmataceae bacterium]